MNAMIQPSRPTAASRQRCNLHVPLQRLKLYLLLLQLPFQFICYCVCVFCFFFFFFFFAVLSSTGLTTP